MYNWFIRHNCSPMRMCNNFRRCSNETRWTFGWKNGRQLSSASSAEHDVSYTYDGSGLRTSKTVDGVRHNYIYGEGRILKEYTSDYALYFFYNADGTPYGCYYKPTNGGGANYYYVTNLQGDVTHLIDSSSKIVASYEYDPYGKVLKASGTMAQINPLRYRGYYYDTESELYYLQSRYYDPATCRFLNADTYASTEQGILGHNMFAYCLNSPISYDDSFGNWPSVCNTVLVNDGGSSSFIEDQAEEPYKTMSFGSSTVGHGGCGPVSVYNALQLLDRRDVTFGDILRYYEVNNGDILDGWLGSLPNTITQYFQQEGYDVSILANNEVLGNGGVSVYADAAILWYWYESNKFPYVGAHYVAFKLYPDAGYYYNSSADTIRVAGNFYSYIDELNPLYCTLILIKKN